MFKTLWNSLSSQKSGESVAAPAFDRNKLKMLAEYFPIGTKLRYRNTSGKSFSTRSSSPTA